MKRSIVALVLLAACASAPPLQPPQWDVVPAGVVEALCRRLQADALATGTVAIVRVTQPLATPENLAALEGVIDDGRSRREPPPAAISRAIPVSTGQGSCSWQPVDVRDAQSPDTLVVEISSPVMNPYDPREAGLFARASLGGAHPAWYWIALAPTRDGGWQIRRVFVLFR